MYTHICIYMYEFFTLRASPPAHPKSFAALSFFCVRCFFFFLFLLHLLPSLPFIIYVYLFLHLVALITRVRIHACICALTYIYTHTLIHTYTYVYLPLRGGSLRHIDVWGVNTGCGELQSRQGFFVIAFVVFDVHVGMYVWAGSERSSAQQYMKRQDKPSRSRRWTQRGSWWYDSFSYI